ncbi:hypothetical protein ACU6U9_01115 [Pseudomonas sp. HK3]
MKTLMTTIKSNLNSRMVSLASVSACVQKVVTLMASYWYSVVFYFGYFSQMPNRH